MSEKTYPDQHRSTRRRSPENPSSRVRASVGSSPTGPTTALLPAETHPRSSRPTGHVQQNYSRHAAEAELDTARPGVDNPDKHLIHRAMHQIGTAPARRQPADWFPALLGSVHARAVAVYLVVRVVGVGMLAAMAAASDNDNSVIDWLTAWDGGWYLGLAEYGYRDLDGGLDGRGEFTKNYTAYAFFPLYPALVSTLARLPFLGIVSSALLLNVVFGAIAACGVVRLARLAGYGPRVGLILVALWAGAPMAISMSMAYTEALFIALAVWALVEVLERNWAYAGLYCIGAGLTRSTAVVLIAVVVLAALVSLARGRESALSSLTCVLLAPLGLLGYWAHVASETGSLTGWFGVQQGWHSELDFGRHTFEWVSKTLSTGTSVMDVGAVLILGIAAVLAALAGVMRLPWPLVLYGAGFALFVVSFSGLMAAKPRFIFPAAVVLLLPVAIGLANRTRPTMLASVGVMVLLGGWYSAYSLVGWPSSM